MLAWRDEPHAKSPRRARAKGLGDFVGVTQMTGFSVVTVWRVAVDVRPGEQAAVRLNDRNIWLTVIREDKRTLDPTNVTGGQGSKHR